MNAFAESSARSTMAGKLLSYRSPHRHQEWTARLGMVIFLAAWAMMFASLFFVYAGLRMRSIVWPPVEYPPLPLGLPALNTAIVAASSVALHVGLRAVRGGRARLLAPSLLGACALGAAFLVSQVVVWADLSAQGLSPGSGGYGSVFFGLTWVHAAHVAVGVLALGILGISALRGAYTPARFLTPRLWAMYWHFVGVVWGLMFVTVYLL